MLGLPSVYNTIIVPGVCKTIIVPGVYNTIITVMVNCLRNQNDSRAFLCNLPQRYVNLTACKRVNTKFDINKQEGR